LARKILLADDSVTAQNMGRKILSDAGYDVVTVNNGSAALKRVAELKPDVVVLDIYMPGYSGLEVCQRLKDSPETERIPVLLTVGKLEPFKPDEARRVRADAYIIKPFEATELLTALARMEDRIVPEQGEPDTGWKSRLRFPSKKKKEEPEPETDIAVVPNFRNFQRGKSKAPRTTPETAPAPAEPSVVPDIPRDITPEELDALSALAAKLDGPAAETEARVAPAVGKAAPVEAKAECVATAPAGEESSAGEVPAVRVEPQGEPETPATNALSEASAVVIAAEPAAVSEVKPAETVHVETFAVEPAPVEREDEPLFATAASAVEPVPQEKEVPAASRDAAAAPNLSETIAIEAKAEEQKPDEPRVEEAPQVVETVEVEESPGAEAAPKVEETPKPENMDEAVPLVAALEEAEVGSAPSDEELAEALRLLTPALGHTDPASIPTRETLVAAGAVLAEQAARNASEAPRWVAAAVAVSPEESALSLETEMFRTLAGMAAARADSDATLLTAAVSPAAVESETAVEAKAEIFEEAPADTMVAVAAVPCEAVAPSLEAVLAERKDSPTHDPQTQVAEEAAEEPAPATFADAVLPDEVEVVSTTPNAAAVSDAAVPAEEVGPPVVETMEVPTSAAEAGGEEAMAKERGKDGKSNWHQIRTGATAGAASNDVVEAAKQAAPAVEEAPKAMAAAAAAEGASAAAFPDSNTIAGIVDSVLADLRPRIVEEIAKKLAGK
jgi:CheY-like chemotaxis protein